MSTHHRHVIRAAVVAVLIAADTSACARVYDTPTDPRRTFPALTVEDMGEQQQVLSTARGPGATLRRTLVLEIAAEVQQTTGYAQERDQLLADVEIAMAGAVISGVQIIKPTGYAPDTVPGMERPIAIGRQRFEITYLTTQGTPGTPMGA